MTTTITKASIGEEDLNRYDGVNSTFTRDSSTGGTLTLNTVGYEVDVLVSYGGGANYTAASITSAITALDGANAVLVLKPGTWTFPTSIAANATIKVASGASVTISAATTILGTCIVEPGGLFVKASSGTMVFTYPPVAGRYQIFSGFALANITGYAMFFPEWFGNIAAYPLVAKTADYQILVSDFGIDLLANKATAIAFTLPTATDLPLGWWVKIKNIGAGILTLTGTIDGVSSPTMSQYEEMVLFSNSSSFYGKVLSRSLPMTGEATAKTATATASLSQMTVTNGDRILVSIFGSTGGADTTGGQCAISWAGTASAKFFNDIGSGGALLKGASISAVYIGSGTFVLEVTEGGTLTLTNTVTNVGSGAPTYANQIYAVFLKKQ